MFGETVTTRLSYSKLRFVVHIRLEGSMSN